MAGKSGLVGLFQELFDMAWKGYITDKTVKGIDKGADKLFNQPVPVELAQSIRSLQNSIDLLAKTFGVDGYTKIPEIPRGYGNSNTFIPTLMGQFSELAPYEKSGRAFADQFMQALQKWEKLSDEQKEAFKNFGSAVRGLIEGTFTVKDGFNVADRATKIKWQAKFFGENGEALLQSMNILHRYGLKDSESLGVARKMNDISNKAATEKGQKELQTDKNYDGLRFLAQYNPEILKVGHSTFERLNMLIEAYAKALSDKTVNKAELQQYATQIFGGEVMPSIFRAAQDSMGDSLTGTNRYQAIRKQEGDRSKQEVGDLDASESIFDAKKDGEVSKYQTGLGANAVMEPFLVPVMNFINDFMNKHHEEVSTVEGYGALGLELYKYGDFAYKLSEAVKALHSKKEDDNGDVLNGNKQPPSQVPQEVQPNPYSPAISQSPKTKQPETLKWYEALAMIMKFYALTMSDKMQKFKGGFRYELEKKLDERDVTSPNYSPLLGILGALRFLPISYQQKSLDGMIGGTGSSRLPLIDRGVFYPDKDRIKTIPLLERDGSTWRTLQNRTAFAGDIAQANQHEKLLQTINNNQQYHTVINVTPSDADPIRVAQLVYQKFQHATLNGNQAAPSKKSTQNHQGILL